MKVIILALLLVILGLVAPHDSSAGQLTTQDYPTDLKSVMRSTPFQQYNLMAQCSRLAYLAGYDKLSADYLAVAKLVKPKSVPNSDLAYRFGFVDGRISNEYARRGRRYSFKQIAYPIFRKDCPSLT